MIRFIIEGDKLPHRRQELEKIMEARRKFASDLRALGLQLPIEESVQLTVISHDRNVNLDNTVGGIFQALDGNTLSPPHVLRRDEQIEMVIARYAGRQEPKVDGPGIRPAK